MEGPCGPPADTAPNATACHPTISICVAWWEQSPKAGEVNSAILIKTGSQWQPVPLEADSTCTLHETLSAWPAPATATESTYGIKTG